MHRAILKAAQGRNDATIFEFTKVSAKLAIIALASNCYSPDVIVRLVARIGVDVCAGSLVIAAQLYRVGSR